MENETFKARVNDNFEFEKLNLEDFDIIATGEHTFHILRDKRSFHGEIVRADYAKKELSLRINGALYQVALSDPYDQLVRQLGLAATGAQMVKEIKAPMPGLVLDLKISAGDQVEPGSPLLILEAMKMENVIKSIGEGKVKKVHVKKGQAVEKNQLLIEME